MKWGVLIAVVGLLMAGQARAETVHLRAGGEVQRWESPRAYSAPYVNIDVSRRGHRLHGTAVSRCKVHYADAKVDALVSTCGKRFRVRISYVSFAGRQPLRVRYRAMKSLP